MPATQTLTLNPPPSKLSYITTLTDITNLTTYAMGNITVAKPGLVILGIVGTTTTNNQKVSSVSLGGVAMALTWPTIANSPDPYRFASLFVDTPGTYAVSVTFVESCNRCGVGAWLLENPRSGRNNLAIATDDATGVEGGQSSSQATGAFVLPKTVAGSYWLAINLHRSNEATTWLPSASVNVRYDANVETARISFADGIAPVTNVDFRIDASWTTSVFYSLAAIGVL